VFTPGLHVVAPHPRDEPWKLAARGRPARVR
jgi:hypothetical protein